jgi:hypothetical protein
MLAGQEETRGNTTLLVVGAEDGFGRLMMILCFLLSAAGT